MRDGEIIDVSMDIPFLGPRSNYTFCSVIASDLLGGRNSLLQGLFFVLF